jgi:hypothetical protein
VQELLFPVHHSSVIVFSQDCDVYWGWAVASILPLSVAKHMELGQNTLDLMEDPHFSADRHSGGHHHKLSRSDILHFPQELSQPCMRPSDVNQP